MEALKRHGAFSLDPYYKLVRDKSMVKAGKQIILTTTNPDLAPEGAAVIRV